MKKHVLAIYPHPDDETFGKAGTIALHTKEGTPVTLICSTLGQMGRNMGKPFFANRETLPQIREQELRDACEVLGIKDLRLSGLRDKTVEFEDPEFVASLILDVIREIQPSIIYTYYPGHGVHPDHDAMSAATVLAVSKLPKADRPVIYAAPVTKNPVDELGPPDLKLDVSSVFEQKMAAYAAHRSQSEVMLSAFRAAIAADPAKKDEIEAPFKLERYWIYQVD
jgi:N-acetylglucosamine malate deacetylase 2